MTSNKYQLMQRGRVAVYLTITAPLFEVSDWEITSDGAEIKRSSSSLPIRAITMISYAPDGGVIMAAGVTLPFTPSEGKQLVEGWTSGLDALREAWGAELEPRPVRVELDEETLAKLGAQVAAGLHGVAQADMQAELELEEVEASSAAQRLLETCGGAPAPAPDEALALLADKLDGDGVAHLMRHASLLGEVARMAHRADGEAVGVYLKAKEAATATAYLTERGFRFKGLVSVE